MLPGPALDSSDSTADYDDSSDENRDRIIVGLHLPDSQRVEVLVHRTVGSSIDHEEAGARGGGREVVTESSVILTDVHEVVGEDGYTTVVANVYAKSHPSDLALTAATLAEDDSDTSGDSDEEYYYRRAGRPNRDASTAAAGKSTGCSVSEKGDSATAAKESQRQSEGKESEAADSLRDDKGRTVLSGNAPGTALKIESNAPQNSSSKSHHAKERKEKVPALPQEKKASEKENVAGKEKKEKHSEHDGKNEKKEKEGVTSSERKEKHAESAEKHENRPRDKDQESSANRKPVADADQLSKESSNGCFGNIFSKKITVIQISGRRNTVPQSEVPKPGNVCNSTNKSATWEKSNGNSSSSALKPKNKMDIQDVSHFNEKLPRQAYESPVVTGPKTGVLLQDYVVISSPGDFTSQDCNGEDSASVSSSLSAGEGGGFRQEEEGARERRSSCCLSASDSFRGSNLSCDIVTYL